MEQGSAISQQVHTQRQMDKPTLFWSGLMEGLSPYLLIAPAMFFLVVFVLLPLVLTIGLSFTDWNLISPEFNWVALENYRKMLADKDFWQVVKNTFVFGGFSVGSTIVLALLLAVFLDKKIRGMQWAKSLLFLPYITPMTAVSVLWIWMFDQHFGLFNWFLGLIGIPQLPWLTQPGWAMAAIIIMKIWKVVGYYAILFVAGLQNIPEYVHEAARIDGATEKRIFFMITLPLLSPFILFVMIVAIIASFQDFDQVYMMTQGGPANSTNMMIYYLYQYGFEFFEVGYASSVAVWLFVFLFAITWLQFYVSKKWVHYS